eukprot:TRINITY_DN1020_c0_g1_i1.p1 TRINITY_DN1020_c0_g1~~TRINITY_DN1020_c0_g1_i1.p1  ORF type:complete len:241 (+),score=41.92 TRINITY_DN1020_c0_g1_i1:91-813(+)
MESLEWAPATKKSRDIAEKLFEDIAELLDSEKKELWRAFLDLDTTFDGKIEPEEFLQLVRRFVKVGAGEGPEAYLRPGLEGLGAIGFPQLLEWWAQRKAVADPTTQGLEAALRNHSSALKWRKFFQRSDEVYLKAEELRAKTPALQAEEAALRDHNRGTGLASDEAQDYALGGAFTYCAGDCGTPLPHTKLGDACTLLGFDVPWSVLRLTKRCYQDPMPYAEFREWWAIHSKASTSRWPF